jgi:predicted deacylase
VTGQVGPIPIPAAGEKRPGYFTFSSEPHLAKYQWPYFALAGARPGPTILITAGIHAAEYTGIEAAIRLGRLLDPADISGTVLIIPLLNRPGFYERSIYVNPEDNDNINRVFPGDPQGAWSQRFAHHLLTEIIARADYAIDLHAGDMIEDLVPFVVWRETGNAEVDREARRMIDAYGVNWAVKAAPSGERPGTLYATAALRGIPAMIAESGRCGLLEEEAVVRHVEGVQNILRALGVLGGPAPTAPPPRVINRFEWLRSPHEGIFHCRVTVDDRVTAGQVIGEMVDLLGNQLGEITAPLDGVVLFLVTSPAIKQDGLLVGIGVPE